MQFSNKRAKIGFENFSSRVCRRTSSACHVPTQHAGHSMIGNGSTLRVTDNSGARLVQCINQTGRSFGVGDLITVAVKKAVKGKVAAGTVRFKIKKFALITITMYLALPLDPGRQFLLTKKLHPFVSNAILLEVQYPLDTLRKFCA